METCINISENLKASNIQERHKQYVQDPYSFRCIPQVHGATKDVIRYVLYRYKYNKFPLLKTLDIYPPCIQVEPTSICNLRCIMCYQSDRTFSGKSNGFMGYMKFDLLKIHLQPHLYLK